MRSSLELLHYGEILYFWNLCESVERETLALPLKKKFIFPHTCDFCGRGKPTDYYVLFDENDPDGLNDKGAELCHVCAWRHRHSIIYPNPRVPTDKELEKVTV